MSQHQKGGEKAPTRQRTAKQAQSGKLVVKRTQSGKFVDVPSVSRRGASKFKFLDLQQTYRASKAAAAELLGGSKVLRLQPTTQLDAHEMLRAGLPARSVTSLFEGMTILGPTEPSVVKALGTSLRTVQRQKKTPHKRLSQEQSARTWKFAEILAKATEVFGSQPDAEQWMQCPATGLEQRRPIELLETPAGTELVEDFLERLEYGVYS